MQKVGLKRKIHIVLFKGIVGIFILAMVLMVGYFYLISDTVLINNRTDEKIREIKVISMQEKQTVSMSTGKVKEYYFNLGTLERDAYLGFCTVNQKVEVVLDGQQVYSLIPDESSWIRKTTGTKGVVVPVWREDSGKDVIVKLTPIYKRGREQEVQFRIGTQKEIISWLLKYEMKPILFMMSLVFIGLLALIIVGSRIRIMRLFVQQEKILREREKELADNKVAIMISQIQPHFLYNSISAISELCMQDPKLARDELHNFATYLRGNMDSITGRKTIPFLKELSHVETYLKLERMRFGERFEIQYDIEVEDFMIPPLTIQPLVENAIKHGISGKENKKLTIIICTRVRNGKICISIIDDGIGFNKKEMYKTDGIRTHVGIKNVKSRIESIVGGELLIESSPEKGTIATIVLK